MPPPSCTGMVTAARIASTAGALTGLPAKAPLRSTMCRYSEALRLEAARLRGRVVVEDGGLAHLAELEAHALAVLQVDGGEQDHAAASIARQGRPRDRRRPSVRYLCRRSMEHVAVSQDRVAPHAVRRCLAPAPPQRSLPKPMPSTSGSRAGSDPPQGPDRPLRLRPAPAVRDLGGDALPRQPRQGHGAVRRAPSGPRRPHRLRPAPAHSRAPSRPSCSRACSTRLDWGTN